MHRETHTTVPLQALPHSACTPRHNLVSTRPGPKKTLQPRRPAGRPSARGPRGRTVAAKQPALDVPRACAGALVVAGGRYLAQTLHVQWAQWRGGC